MITESSGDNNDDNEDRSKGTDVRSGSDAVGGGLRAGVGSGDGEGDGDGYDCGHSSVISEVISPAEGRVFFFLCSLQIPMSNPIQRHALSKNEKCSLVLCLTGDRQGIPRAFDTAHLFNFCVLGSQ